MLENMMLPKVIFGTSAFGNLYRERSLAEKTELVKEMLVGLNDCIMFDTAGKYGAGLALESLGSILRSLNIPSEKVRISNKIGWRQMPLPGNGVPAFEPGIWFGLKNDCFQDFSKEGMRICYNEGLSLLNSNTTDDKFVYNTEYVSLHDPDDYVNTSTSSLDREIKLKHIVSAYEELLEMKKTGICQYIGIGAKTIDIIEWVSDQIPLDFAMIACSFSIYSHSAETCRVLHKLRERGVLLIFAAVFQSGFLLGGDHFNYRAVSEMQRSSDAQVRTEIERALVWRRQFEAVCSKFSVTPLQACIQFVLQEWLYRDKDTVYRVSASSVAVGPATREEVVDVERAVHLCVPHGFWEELYNNGLISVSLA